MADNCAVHNLSKATRTNKTMLAYKRNESIHLLVLLLNTSTIGAKRLITKVILYNSGLVYTVLIR
jgi:hypothetical protein